MRFALIALAMLLAGCTDDASPGGGDAANPDESSGAPTGPAATRPYQNQTLGSFDVDVVMGSPAGFDVDVPDHAIDITVAPSFVVATMVTLTVDIEECGAADFPGLTASAVGNLGTMVACAGGSPGSHAATVSVDAGVFVGTITVTAMVAT